MRTVVATAVACALLTGLSAAADVQASIKKEISIPAGGLGPALRALSDERKVHFIFVAEDVRQLKTPGASGSLTVDEALNQLLIGTGLTFRYIDDQTVSILPLNAALSIPSASNAAVPTLFTTLEEQRAAKQADKYGRSSWNRIRLAQAESPAPVSGREARVSSNDDPVRRPALEEVVVTAQRTEENIQRASVAITPLTGEAIEDRGITELSTLSIAVPALNVFRTSGPYNNLRLRGISAVVGQFGDPAILVNVDQVYQSRGFGAPGQFFDLERVEVVKGPQGIFYGRNATGGAINIVTQAPEIGGGYGGNVGFDVGNFDQMIANGAVNLPLGDELAARIAFQTESRDGFFSDGSGDVGMRGARAQLRWEPSKDFDLTVRTDYTWDENSGVGSTAYCAETVASFPPGPAAYNNCPRTGDFFGDQWTSVVQQQPGIVPDYPIGPGGTPGLVASYGHNEYYSASVELNWALGGGTLTAIPAYHHDSINYMFSNGFNFRDVVDHDQYTFETRFASDQTQPVRYVVGAYYFTNEQEGGGMFDSRQVFGGFHTPSSHVAIEDLANDGSSWAAFANVTWAVTENFRLSAGVRYTWERKESDSLSLEVSATGPESPYTGAGVNWASEPRDVTLAEAEDHGTVAVGDKEWSNTSYRVGIDWDWREGSLLYAAVTTGFKSGGFILNDPNDLLGFTFDPEEVTAYSIGSKNQFFDDRLRLNLELFYYDYQDQQIQALLQNGSGTPLYATINAGESSIKGAELELEFLPWQNTRLSADIQYLDATYDEFLIPTAFLGPAGNPDIRCGAVPVSGVGAAFAYDCSGMQMVNSPEWTVTLGIEHTFTLANGGSVVPQIDTRYETDRELNYNYYVASQAGSNTRTNASLTYNSADERWSLSAYVRNIEDEATVDLVEPAANQSGLLVAFLRPPRQYGMRFKFRF